MEDFEVATSAAPADGTASTSPPDAVPSPTPPEGAPLLAPRAAAYADVEAAIDDMLEAERKLNQAYAERARAIDTIRLRTEDAVRRFEPERAEGWDVQTLMARQVRSEVAAALRISEPAAGNLIAHASSFVHHLPSTLTALETGEISYKHASVFAEEAWNLPVESWREFEETLLVDATTMSPPQFARKARKVRETTHPESIAVRRSAALSDRAVTLTPARDGMAYLTLYLAAEDAIAIHRRMTNLARSQQEPDEERTLTQLRVDTATHLLTCGEVPIDSSPAGDDHPSETVADDPATTRTIPAPHGGLGRGIRATVFVTVPVLTLLGHDDEPAQLDGYGPIDMQTALRLVGTAPNMIRLLTHPETGTVLSVGRTRHTIPNDLRLFVQVRDGTCRASGCSNPADDCEIDHVIEWQFGGATEAGNLTSLCKSHHRLKSNTDWTPDLNAVGDITWTAPSGKKYTTRPATRMRPTPTTPWAAPGRERDGGLGAAPETPSGTRPGAASDTGPLPF